MKKFFILSTLIFLLSGTTVLRAQENYFGDGETNTNTPDNADEAVVAGNGTKPGQNSTGAHVNTFTGDAWATATDFNYPRNGFPMMFERYFHNGISSPYGELGQGWMTNYDICLFVPLPNSSGTKAILVGPHLTWTFPTSDGGNTFTTPAGCFYQLQTVTGSAPLTYVLTTKSGSVEKFTVLPGGAPNLARLIEMDDLNGNKVAMNYQSFNYFQFVQSQYGYWSGTLIQQTIENYSDLRLQTATGNNWGVTLTYNDNPSQPTTVAAYLGTSPIIYIDTEWNNPAGSRLQQVTNSAGDTIVFDNQAPTTLVNTGPTTQVWRSPSSLNASYQYYSNSVAQPSGNPVTLSTLKQISDQMAPPGYRNLTYVSENNGSGINNPVRQIINALGQLMFTYDYSTDGSGNKLTSTSGPNGLIETDVYDSTSRMIQKMFVVDGVPHTDFYTLNANNLVTNSIDGNGNPVTTAYDSLGNMTYQQDAEGYSTTNVYDNNLSYPTSFTSNVSASYSRLSSSTDKNLVTRNYIYDANGNGGSNGNLVRVSEPGKITSYSYNFTSGSLTQKTIRDANNHTTTSKYDQYGAVTFIQGPAIGAPENLPGAVITYVKDARGHITSMTDPLTQTTSYTYTSNKMWLQEVDYPVGDGTNEQFTYDANGNKTSAKDRNGIPVSFIYDGIDHLTESYEASGTLNKHTIYKFDAIGNQLSITDNKGQKTTFAYNEQNLVKVQSDPMGEGVINAYDGALNIHTSKDLRGITKTMTYFKNNRPKSVQFSDGTPTLSYNYDGNGNRTSMMDGVGLKTYSYDPLNRLQTVADIARNFNLTYTYDAIGNKLSEQNNKISGTMYYGYYEDNMAKAVTDVDGTRISYVYDAFKNPINVSYPNGASVTYTYVSTNHRLQSLQNLNSHQEVLSSFSYVYDGIGNATTITDLTGLTTFGYDNLHQLTTATYPGPQSIFSYSYDGVGNRSSLVQGGVTQAYSYDSDNEMASGPSGAYGYDKAGNMISAGGVSFYNWNSINQLVSTGSVTFVYDGDGHRVRKITTNGTINYFYDGSSVLVETNGNGNVLKSYNPGISVNDQHGNNLFYLYNGHGDVAGLLDNNQNLVQGYSYDSFGKTLGDQKDTNNYRYVGSGAVFSEDDGNLQYMWRRWYDPSLGRFISRDPEGFAGGDLNLYVYVKNNPLNLTDPNGEAWNTNGEHPGDTPTGDQSGSYYSRGPQGGWSPSQYNGYGGAGWTGYKFYGNWAWFFNQSTGLAKLFDPSGNFTGINHQGYSGFLWASNEPRYQNVEDVGPIPTGTWLMDDP
ncbi:MAG TPA: RHS repeat-associated core domain-containing protein, partial [bacterium]